MNANASRSRSFDSGSTRMPRMPVTTWIALLEVPQTAACRAAVGHHDHGIHALIFDLDPFAIVANLGAVIW